MIYFTSDLHFGHDKDFLFEPRGFKTIEEHNEQIIKNINSIVKPDDDLWILGDLMLGDTDAGIEKVKKLNGHLHIVFGNHDTNNRILKYAMELPDAELCGYSTILKYGKYNFYISHYPSLVSNFDEKKPLAKKVINLCGHSHIKDKWADIDKGLIYHCELDAHNNYPVSIDEILDNIKERIIKEKENDK